MTASTALGRALADLDPHTGAAAALERLVGLGLADLPLPGCGATLQRWQALAEVAAHDLSLAKLYESHTDAAAIWRELQPAGTPLPDGTWCVWAAEAPGARVTAELGLDGVLTLSGRKCWCSGAASASHALLTAWAPRGTAPQLVWVELGSAGVEVLHDAWHAVGMAGSASLDVQWLKTRAHAVGEPGAYLSRPGFWQGGAGVAACWYGGARALGEALHRSLADAAPGSANPFRQAALGKVDAELRSTAALLREAAQWIDAHPRRDASEVALRVRLRAEQSAALVQDEVGRALGAGPFCRDAHFARMAADLPVFVRQSHAERDFAALGERVAESQAGWTL